MSETEACDRPTLPDVSRPRIPVKVVPPVEVEVSWVKRIPDVLVTPELISRVELGVDVPIPILVLMVSTLKALEPLEFWTWKAVVELAEFSKIG